MNPDRPRVEFDPHHRLPGTINFRDLGGYNTTDGGIVITGRLFRSGHLAHAETESKSKIAALNISLVCDFRTAAERQEHLHQYADGHTPLLKSLPIWPVATPGVDNTVARLLRGDIDLETALIDQANGYREFVRDQSAQFAGMFTAILEQEYSGVLLHCSAGKDRTGIASALLLTALDVPFNDVRHDYLMSKRGYGATAQTQFYVDKYWDAHKNDFATEPTCSQADIHQLFSVQPVKIEAAFDEMKKISGSIDGYLSDRLGLKREARRALKQRYLKTL
ncbi:MAG: tyrosine-protein phosphatase [Rhodospirillaceae bacterium]